MGASTVTGKGDGVAKNQKGPGNGRNQYQPLVCPNIVAAGLVTKAGGAGDVTVPLSGMTASEANLVVVAVPQVAAVVSAIVKSKADTSGVMSSFVITAGGNGAIAWMVVKP